MIIPVQNEKALFLQCHIVVIAVKLIYGTGFGNDVMNGVGLTEGLLNSIKPTHITVASHSAKVLILLPISQLMAGFEIISELEYLR